MREKSQRRDEMGIRSAELRKWLTASAVLELTWSANTRQSLGRGWGGGEINLRG